jgi:alkylated DNA nucleotide flippase Atl1
MTYGQIARLIPEPTFLDGIAYRRIRARWVGYALAACPGDIPWQRVINQRGKPSTRETGGHLAQEALLAAEGTPRRPDGSIDLEAAGWSPANVDWASILPEGDEPREATKGRLP